MPQTHAFAPTRTSGPRIRLVSSPMEPTPERSWIGKADLDKARALLSRARQDIEPRQWEQLDRKLTAAERAFERFSRAAKASRQAAEVVRGAEGVAQAGRAKTLAEVLPRVGPLLVGLVLLYPSSTAGPEIDRRPEWVDAQREYEARLLDVAEESRRLMEEFERQEAEEVVPDVDSDPVAAVTAPTPWWKKTNPATGRNYTSMEEYDRVPRHPDQTCKNSRLDELEAEKKLLMKLVPPYDPKAPRSKVTVHRIGLVERSQARRDWKGGAGQEDVWCGVARAWWRWMPETRVSRSWKRKWPSAMRLLPGRGRRWRR
jgi:hypothetical protein